MGVISNISVMLSANAAGVKRGVSEAKGALSSYGQSVKGVKGNPFAGAEKGAGSFGGSLGVLTTRLGAFGAAFGLAFSAKAMVGAVTASWEMMDSQKELADQLGISTKALSGLSYISDVVGGDTAALSGSFAKFQKLMGNAANGQEAATKSLAKYGLTAKQLIGLPLEDQIGLISDKFKTLGSQEQKVVMATDLFGKSGASMINMLSLGSKEIDTMITKAEDLGIVFSDDMAQKASDATDAMLEFNKALQGASNTMAVEFAPAATTILQKLTEMMPLLPKLAAIIPGVGNLMVDPKDFMFTDSKSGPTSMPPGSGPLMPTTAPPSNSFGIPASIFDPVLSPTSPAEGSGVLTTQGKEMGAAQGSAYIDSFYDSIRAGGTGDPQLDLAKARVEQVHQDHKQRLLDIEAIAKEEKLSKEAAEGLSDMFKLGADALEDQKKALEDSKKIMGGFEISKWGRVAAGGNTSTGGISAIAGSTFGGSSGNGAMGDDQKVISELQEQTGYLRVLASKPQVASFA